MEVLRAGDLEATFHPEVGMVASSLVHRGEQLLAQRGGLEKYAAAGSTFGIPLLHPWANRLAGWRYGEVELDRERSPIRVDENDLPIHGLLAAARDWIVTDRRDGGFTALFSFDRPKLLLAFPFPHEVEIAVTLTGSTVTIQTTVRATGAAAVPVAFGYHPYLTLPGVPREDYRLELPVTSRAVLDDRGIPTGASDPVDFEPGPLGAQTFDDMFLDVPPGAAFALEGGGRRIEVVFEEGYPVAQLFAPEGEPFICFEPMTAPTNALLSGDGLRRVEPGGEHSARFSIRLS